MAPRGPSVDYVFKTSRRAESSDRLSRLLDRARAEPVQEISGLPEDQEWVDDSVPETAAPAEPWWRRRLVEHWVPGRRARRIAFASGGVLVGVAIAVGVVLSGSGSTSEAPPALPAASVTSSPAEPSGTSIVVSVVGKVASPGLVTLPDGARVADALAASGGPVPGVDLGPLNLARRIADGEQIYVGVPAPPGVDPAGPAGPGGSGAPAKIDLNSAPLDALDTLPGVGPVTAQRIVDWRTEHGPFTTVEQLREVDGIGQARFEKLKDLVVVS